MKRLLDPLLALLAVPLLAGLASATWSIVVLNRSTGEVCCATATCISGFDIRVYVPVVVVGKGAAATQLVVPQMPKRRLIRDGLRDGGDPQRILDAVLAIDATPASRQYGIVAFSGPPVSYTGSVAGDAHPARTGIVGDLEYAIQGNVLAGDEVVLDAELALLLTEGDLVTKVMAGMEAARARGGDGRCSCAQSNPTGCGSPPPSFDKSAHTACIVLARMGDADGSCTSNLGCANGPYYLSETVQGGGMAPDPVLVLQRKVDHWRAALAGVPDHLLSEVRMDAARLVADGQSTARVRVRLVDVDGHALTAGGQTLTISDVGTGGPVATAGAPLDLGNGTHEFELRAGSLAGHGRFRIEVAQGTQLVRLYPDLELEVDPLVELHCGWTQLPASSGRAIPFVLNLPQAAGMPYRVLASASGTSPGTPFGSGTLPLNDDRLLQWSSSNPATIFLGSYGLLDAAGRAEARLTRTASVAAPFIGTRLDFCAVIGAADPYHFSNTTGFEVLP